MPRTKRNKAADFGGFLAAPCQKAAPDTYIEPNDALRDAPARKIRF
jgi:hypothetical protein